jgi:hypothetical protein
MTIRQQGGVFGRHPKLESIEVDGQSDLGPITVTDATLPVTVNRTGGNGRHATFQDNGSDRGGIAEYDFDLIFGTPTAGIRVSRFNSYIGPRTVDNGAATLDLGATGTNQWGNLYLSGNVIPASGSGIDFSATSGTGTSELFDDYEEGTFTPEVGGTTTAGTYTYAIQTGVYTKVGDLVTVTINLVDITESVAGSGSFRITGLPFTASGGAIHTGTLWARSVNFDAATVYLIPYVSGNAIFVNEVVDNAPGGSWNIADLISGSARVYITLTYKV